MKKIAYAICIMMLAVILTGCGKKDENKESDSNKESTQTTDNSQNNNSDEDEDNSDNSESKACDVLTKEIAVEILGGEVEQDSSGDSSCTYTTTSESLDDLGVLTISITSSSSSSEARSSFEVARDVVYGEVEEVNDIDGVEAYWASSVSQLSLLIDNKWIIVSGLSAKYDDVKVMCVDASKLLVKNL